MAVAGQLIIHITFDPSADTISLFYYTNLSTAIQVPLLKTGNSWWTDKYVKFHNPTSHNLTSAFAGKNYFICIPLFLKSACCGWTPPETGTGLVRTVCVFSLLAMNLSNGKAMRATSQNVLQVLGGKTP